MPSQILYLQGRKKFDNFYPGDYVPYSEIEEMLHEQDLDELLRLRP